VSAQDDADIIAAARLGFLDEAADMLTQFEQALLVMETTPDDAENLNAAFRAAHTIKGTAGLFGCDAVVSFTHEVETLMEALRAGELTASPEIAAALLAGLDQMEALIGEVRSGEQSPEVQARSLELGRTLRALQGGSSQAAEAASTDRSASPCSPAMAGTAAAAPALAPTGSGSAWHLSLRFGADSLRNGLDPLAFLRYLGSLGQVVACHTLAQAVPVLQALDAENCHLGFELRLQSDKSQTEIEQVFDFAREDCSLAILPPEAGASAYTQLLMQRSEGDAQAGADLCSIWRSQGVALEGVLAQDAVSQGAAAPSASSTPGSAGATPSTPAAGHTAGAALAVVPAADERRQSNTADRRAPPRSRAGEETRFIKVRADKLDHLIDLIGELVIAGSGAQMVANAEASPAFLEATQRVADLVQATRDGALALRMVPVGETFSRFQRVVRDISKQLGKEIELVVTGGDTELDKSMVDLIGDPLMHLVRNSLDHGIETPAERTAAGKSAQGRLGLNAYHEAGAIVIEVSDDGKGLGRERIVKKATERGLIPEGAVLSDADVWQLIFAPGFSTADVVTDISGRGVGMDVVKRNIEALRGQISLASSAGRGTTTQIRLPLTLAMIDGFLTLVDGVHYVLPLAVVSECIDVPRECHAEPGRTCGTFDLRGEVLPYLDLALFYGGTRRALQPQAGRRALVVVRDGAVRLGLVVDRLLGEHQTVIKPLAGIFKPLEALAGSTILGSGDVALVLDMQGLMAAATQAGGTAGARTLARAQPSSRLNSPPAAASAANPPAAAHRQAARA
jgi:two-component system, chemotaxis family, sensor kinase CheA